MAEHAHQFAALPHERMHALTVPREHGAWGMLLMPLLTGAAIGFGSDPRWLPLFLFTIVALGLFWMRTPVESWLGTTPMRAHTPEERSAVLRVAISLAGVVLCALGCLLWRGQNTYLLLLGAISAAAFAAQALVKKFGRSFRMPAQMIGALGLTSTAPAAYYVFSGHFDRTAWALWFANWLFASDQIHFVQLRIHAARAANTADKLSRGRGFLVGQAVLCAVLLLSSRSELLPSLSLVAFVPVLVRGLVWFFQHPTPLAVRRLGWQELAQASLFACLLVFSFRWNA